MMEMNPRILLSGRTGKLQNYIDAVNRSGGIAEGKYLPEINTDYDGLILCGGADVDPGYYKQPINGSVDIDEARDAAEFALVKAFLDAGKPILGICRGCQLLNIYFGGSLFQDIKNADEHTSYDNVDLVHQVTAIRESVPAKLYGEHFAVNSHHHQAIDRLGDGLKATMWANRGTVVEGIEHECLPVFAVQWHPERMCYLNYREDTVDGRKIFEYFLQLCRK